MTIEQKVSWLSGLNAVTNWTLSLRAIVDPTGAAMAFGGSPPDYPFVIRLWSGPTSGCAVR